jgi:hypothetical protein
MPASAARPVLLELVAASPTPLALDTLKLERLRELRATIDALRHEQASADPLMAWVLAQEHAAGPHGD